MPWAPRINNFRGCKFCGSHVRAPTHRPRRHRRERKAHYRPGGLPDRTGFAPAGRRTKFHEVIACLHSSPTSLAWSHHAPYALFRTDAQLLDDVPRIAHLPAVIVQGRYDVVCPMASAWELHRRWPRSRLVVVPDAGHSVKEPGITTALLDATDAFADLLAGP